MLQFITDPSGRRPIPEQVKAAIAGGCRWIELSAPGYTEQQMRDTAKEIIPICKDADAFVIMREHLGLAAELRLHGIFMDVTSNPRRVRQELGGEAVIGVAVNSLQDILDLRSADIDYVVLTLPDKEKRDEGVATVAMAREKGVELPIVAEGEFTAEMAGALIGAGFSGVALSSTIANAEDPEATVREILSVISPQ